jgi:nucleoside-diphosphate-sugar epimerase
MCDLVTGASGFIGSHLARALVARGRRVRCLVHRSPLPEDLLRAGVEPVPGDLTVPESLAAALVGIERVFHCAARVADWGDLAEFQAANVDGTAHLLEAASTAGVIRLIHMSTTDVYGFPDVPVDESAPLVRRGWPYGDTKIAAEELVWNFARHTGLAVTVMRPANVYGVGSQSFVGEIADLLRRREMIHLGCRRPPAGLCHVDNLVDCVLLAAENAATAGEAYNVSDGSSLSWCEFTDGLADALGLARPRITLPRRVAYLAGWGLEKLHAARRPHHRPLLTRMAVEIFTSDQSFSIEKARKDLGYTPVRTFASTLPDLARWLQGGAPC